MQGFPMIMQVIRRRDDERQLALCDECDILARTVVIIPARNEQLSIQKVLDDLPEVARVIVVNNGSSDATPTIAQNAGAYVVDEDIPGYGRACRSGLAALRRLVRLGEKGDSNGLAIRPSYVVFLDADFSDHPELLPTLVKPIHSGIADFVLGSRLLGQREPGAMPIQSVLGNKLACLLMRVIWGGRYSDLGPFRAIRYESLRRLQMKDTNFGWTVEMQIKATRAKLRTLEIPVPYRCRIGESKISGTISGTIRAGYKILFTIAKYAMPFNRAGNAPRA